MSELWTDSKSSAAGPAFWLYCIVERGAEAGPCKIGVATYMNKRLSSLQGGNWRALDVVWQIRLASRARAIEVEQYCLSCLRPSIYGRQDEERLPSEWVNCAPLRVLETALRLLNAEDDGEIRRLAA